MPYYHVITEVFYIVENLFFYIIPKYRFDQNTALDRNPYKDTDLQKYIISTFTLFSTVKM